MKAAWSAVFGCRNIARPKAGFRNRHQLRNWNKAALNGRMPLPLEVRASGKKQTFFPSASDRQIASFDDIDVFSVAPVDKYCIRIARHPPDYPATAQFLHGDKTARAECGNCKNVQQRYVVGHHQYAFQVFRRPVTCNQTNI